MKRHEGKKHLFLKGLSFLILAGIIVYLGIIGYVIIREKSVSHELKGDHYDAIIVLGAQVRPDGSPSVQLGWRLDAAIEAWREKQVPIVVCGAQGSDEPMPEAEAMRKYMIEKGIPAEDIMIDPDSFNTNQNLTNAQKLLSSHTSIGSILVVTSDYHVPRSLAIAEDLGFKASGLGSPCKPEYWLKNHTREALAWIKYWLTKYTGMLL